MSSSERICSNCSWQNEPTARMCGGCGQPLGTLSAEHRNVQSAPRHADGSLVTSTTTSGNAPTEYLSSGASAPYTPNVGEPYSPPPPRGATPARWPASATQPQPAYTPPPRPVKRRGGSCLQRTLLALLALVVVTSCCGVGLWSFILRPAVHTAADSQIRAGLDTMFDEASNSLEQVLPLVPKGTHPDILPIKASDLTARIQEAAAKKGMPTDTTVHFIDPDGVQVTYLLSGKPHTVTTHLYVVGGRIRARNTTDDFPLNVVESNAELETTINESLTHLTTDLHVTELHMADDTLHFSITK